MRKYSNYLLKLLYMEICKKLAKQSHEKKLNVYVVSKRDFLIILWYFRWIQLKSHCWAWTMSIIFNSNTSFFVFCTKSGIPLFMSRIYPTKKSNTKFWVITVKIPIRVAKYCDIELEFLFQSSSFDRISHKKISFNKSKKLKHLIAV